LSAHQRAERHNALDWTNALKRNNKKIKQRKKQTEKLTPDRQMRAQKGSYMTAANMQCHKLICYQERVIASSLFRDGKAIRQGCTDFD
jgi:hypothetical protein